MAELLARVHDHVEHRYINGFRMLTLGWSDGNTFLPLAFSHLSSVKDFVHPDDRGFVENAINQAWYVPVGIVPVFIAFCLSRPTTLYLEDLQRLCQLRTFITCFGGIILQRLRLDTLQDFYNQMAKDEGKTAKAG